MKYFLIIAVIIFVLAALILVIAQISDIISMYKEALQNNDSFFVNLPLMREASKKRKLTPAEYFLLVSLEMDSDLKKDGFECAPRIETKCVKTKDGYVFLGFYNGNWNFIYSSKFMISIINSSKKYFTPCTPSYLNK